MWVLVECRPRSSSEPRHVSWGRVHITSFERKLSIDSVPGREHHAATHPTARVQLVCEVAYSYGVSCSCGVVLDDGTYSPWSLAAWTRRGGGEGEDGGKNMKQMLHFPAP